MKVTPLFTVSALAILATACSASTSEPKKTMEPKSFSSLLSSADRPAEDGNDDTNRKPAEVLTFMNIKEGQTIFEMEAGSGYYTELFSNAVGSDGIIYMQNPLGFDGFLGDSDDKRLADNRLANVKYLRSQFDSLNVEDNSVDLVTWILGPHEIYFIPDGTEGFGDASKSYAEIARILKPGGSFVAIDHVAPEGAGKEAGHTMHRIEKSIVIEEAKAAGLDFIESSPILKNPDDPLNISPFDPSIRRKTHRFLLKFSKAE